MESLRCWGRQAYPLAIFVHTAPGLHIVCIGTEDMMAGIKKANDELRNNVDNEVIVGSADVKALYPSLDVDFTVDKVCEVFYGSEVRVVLTFIMKNHVYKFDGTVRKRAKGGAIGLELTGILAQIFMVWWDREFKARVKRLGIPLYMYNRYVDDINVIVGAVEPGVKIAGGDAHGRRGV